MQLFTIDVNIKLAFYLEVILKHTDSDHPHHCNLTLAKEVFIFKSINKKKIFKYFEFFIYFKGTFFSR